MRICGDWLALAAGGAMLLTGACSAEPDTAAANDGAPTAAADPAGAGGGATPAADAAGAPAAPPAPAGGGAVADGSYSCHKISGSMLVNMGTVRVSGGQPDTSVLESVGAKFKGVEPTAEGFRLSYESKSGWAEVMDCERE